MLFRRKRAPTRYAESDIYWANEDLGGDGGGDGDAELPSSGLLVSVHRYASLFYEHVRLKGGSWGVWAGRSREEGGGVGRRGGVIAAERGNKRSVDERSMEESALLAFGILLEEAGREVLGRGGEKVFVEGSSRRGEDGEGGGGVEGVEVIMEREAGRRKEKERGVKRRKVNED